MSTWNLRSYRFALFAAALVLGGAFGPNPALAQDNSEGEQARKIYESISWQTGPCVSKIGSNAQINVPAGFRFTGAQGAQVWNELTQNPPDPSLLGVLMPAESADWFLVFQFDESGYVKDDDKDKLDENAILTSIKDGTEASNEERLERGWPTISITGWEQSPKYNPSTNNLEWAIKAESEGHPILNHNTRILGRRGVTSVALVVDPAQLNTVLPQSRNLLSGFEYVSGERYSEWRTGDKVAEYGLAGLVAGGAAAVLIKKGFLGKFLKPLIIGVLAVFGFISKVLFGRRSNA
jgi:uncharacterized membrane-anchored protein